MSASPFRRRNILVGLLAVVVLLVAGVLLALWLSRRGQDYLSRPLVRLHRPTAGQPVELGKGLLVFATARSSAGVARLELWAEGEPVAQREVEAGERRTPLALSAMWEPEALGPHVLYVRAVGANGAEGHAAVTVEVVQAEPAFGEHTVLEGESLDSIAIDYGTQPDELSSLNPNLLPGAPEVGDVLRVPLDFAASEEPAAEESPAEPSEPPGIPESVADEVVPEAPVRVQLEALSLTTDAVYESVHCYAGLGSRPPRWYPDADDDPSTDESFASLGGTAWDVASHMSGDAAPSLLWPTQEDLPFEATCVGIRGGGTDAVELGAVSLAIPSRLWDGERRWASSEGGEGAFDLEYRVGPGEVYMLDLDLGMTPPVHLRYDDRRQSLRWDYQRLTEDEPPIDGFLIFLNDTLVWEARWDARESRLPYEWLTPPCGESYVFTVRAFRRPYPSGPYSVPSNAVTLSGGEAGTEACNREFVVTFTTLHTENMGGDGDRDPGDMGPVYGSIYANDAYSEFDGACTDTESGAGYICVLMGLDNGSSYDLMGFPWEGSYPRNQLFVELAEDENLSVGFSMTDADTGRNNEDDEVCSGQYDFFFSRVASGPIEETILAGRSDSSDIRCRIDFTVASGPGSPVGVGGGDLPLPWIDLVDLTTDPETGQLQIHIRNTGTAAWANHDLEIGVTAQNGASRGSFSWPLYLDPGASTVLTHPALAPEPAMDVCVEIDPDDQVLERHEYTGALGHGRICAELPDLTIERADLDEPGNRLLWTVRNLGEAEVTTLDIGTSIEYASGQAVLFPHPLRNPPVLQPGGTSVMEWPLDTLDFEAMQAGYTLTLDSRNQLLEENEDNNVFEVRGGRRLRVEWLRSRLYWYPTLSVDDCYDYRIRNSQDQELTFEVFAETPFSSRRVASWTRTEEVGWPGVELFDYEGIVAEFDILGQEQLRVHLAGELSHDDMGDGSEIFMPEEDWGSLQNVTSTSSVCRPRDDDHAASMGPPDSDWGVCGNWSVRYTICTVR